MIRILHVLGGLDRGGAESMVMNLYRTIDRTKVQFDFVIHTEKHQAYYDEIISLGGKIYSFPAFKGTNAFFLRKKWAKFFKEHPDYKILHSHVRSYASLYLPVARKAGLKTIIHSHSTSNGRGFASVVKRIMQYPLRFQADYFFACSKEAGKWLFGKKICNSEGFHILQNAINVEKYRFNQMVREEYRKKLGLENKKIFIHVGRFHPAKNHLFLLDLFAQIYKNDKNAILILAGDGELRPVIEHRIADLNIQNDVVLLGSRNDVGNLLQAADCFLFPSNWEGLPVTVVEAQAAGLPCLVSDRITREVGLSDLVKYLPINQGIQPWIDFLGTCSFLRKDVSRKISSAGFDIQSTSLVLTDFYQGIANV